MASHLPYYKGDFTVAVENGPPLAWIDPINFGKLFVYQYCMRADKFALAQRGTHFKAGGLPLSADDPHKTGAILVEGSNPTAQECGIVQWTNTYMTVPQTRTVPELFAATYQFFDSDSQQIAELSIGVTAHVTYQYFNAPPVQLEQLMNGLRQKYVLVSLAGATLGIGTPPGVDDDFILGLDEDMKQVRGHIWEKRTVMVPKLTPEELS